MSSFLPSTQNQKIKTLALEVISLLSRNKDCVTEIAECGILGSFLKTIKDDDFQKQRVLDTLSGLTNAPQLVKEAHAKGKEGNPRKSWLPSSERKGNEKVKFYSHLDFSCTSLSFSQRNENEQRKAFYSDSFLDAFYALLWSHLKWDSSTKKERKKRREMRTTTE